nr:T9SS type A sorting domain-containing protein [uncultured Brumimicrobium sp.]
MKNSNNICLVVSFLLLSFLTLGQSISGNMNSENIASLGYGNVDIYKGEEKIASVLTDALGNFQVELDTGYYRVEFKYEGHEKLVTNIQVNGDEKNDFSLSRKKGYIAPVYEEVVISEVHSSDVKKSKERPSRELEAMFSDALSESSEAKIVHDMPTFAPKEGGNVSAMKLTAGEINDFSKWEMWNDFAAGELSTHQQKWDLYFTERYTVQVKNENGFPIVDALVQLLDVNKNVRYESRTDNTGKAELWGKLGLNDLWEGNASALVHYKGKTFPIRRLIEFKQGVNSLTLTAQCGASQLVDIAFVVDATGSMGDEINYLKAELNSVIFKAKNDHPELTFNFGNVFYRDSGDEYLTRRHDFTDVLSSSIEFISQQHAAGGGDYEEAVEVALEEALDKLEWSREARTRILFLVLDAPPHNSPEVRQKLKDIARKAAAKGIRIVPLAASGIQKDTEYLMRSLAQGTNGTYAFLTGHSGIGSGHIEPSTDEYEVELLNDLMVRLIDTYTFVADCQEEDDFDDLLTPDPVDSLITVEWNVWPNPTQGDLNIKISEDVGELFITDLTGKIVNRFTELRKGRVLKTNIAQYSKGIYLITFIHEEKVYTKKVVLT